MPLNYKNFLLLNESDDKTELSKSSKKGKAVNKSLIFSEKFKNALITIQNIKQSNISKRLLELENDPNKLFDFSYIDAVDDGENVTYLQSNRIDRFQNENKPIEEYWTTKMRTTQKVVRFIKQILPTFSDDSIQKFVLKYRTVLKENKEEQNFELVEGNDIVYYYDSRNYENHDGTLGSSCMSGEEAGEYLNCYRNNPNQCKMLILKNETSDKIKGRALVWHLTVPENTIFMDRIYVNDDYDVMLFKNYAKKQGWLSKSQQVYGNVSLDLPDGTKKEIKLEVVLDNVNYNLYPYVDTVRYFYKDLKTMASHANLKSDYIILTDTEGHYEGWDDDNDDEDPLVYDAYNDENIPEHRATWCEYDQAYINTDDAIRLPYNGKHAFPNSPHIAWSEYTKKWYAKVDSTFCQKLDSWVWNKYVVDVYVDKDKINPPYKTHRFELNKTIGLVNNEYYDLNILKLVKSESVVNKKGKSENVMIYEFK